MTARLIAVVAVVAAVISLAGSPSVAGESARLMGEVVSATPGSYTITWTLENLTATAPNSTGLGGSVGSAVLTGAAEGDIAMTFVPNPFNFDDLVIIGQNTVAGEAAGIVTLDVVVFFTVNGPFDFSYETSASVELDGTCVAPTTTTASTPSDVAAAVATRPAFTG